jgi:4'-phosphopantetheinyl transferase
MMILLGMASVGTAAADIALRFAVERDFAYAARRRTAEARDTTVLARGLVRAMLDQGSGAEGWELDADDRGKPLVFSPRLGIGRAVSMSHTRGWVAAAIAESGDIGVDVERHKERDVAALAGYAFGPAERAEAAAAGTAGFYRIWTLREAIAKATGEGLARAANRHDMAAGGPRDGLWTRADEDRLWHLGHWRIGDCSLALALRTERGVTCSVGWPAEFTPGLEQAR